MEARVAQYSQDPGYQDYLREMEKAAEELRRTIKTPEDADKFLRAIGLSPSGRSKKSKAHPTKAPQP